MKLTNKMKSVTVEISGGVCQVPEGMTVVQALWHTGHPLLRGIGCLGGVCGACTFTYRQQGEAGIQSGLACQVAVKEGMAFTLPASFAPGHIRDQILDVEEPQAGLLEYYPETRRCTRCNACTLVCPQEIDVRAGVVGALTGDFSEVSEKFYNCVMCGLCASVCDVAIQPHRVALYARRVQASHRMPVPEDLLERVRQIQNGHFDADWEQHLHGDPKTA